ncbi:hypothetical protein EVAR_21880_1 [Eumeta japonica]|uniref:Uncharacterized protein n=1 Tax=Eumeta variegata TaxID=151549 RepID=A0A4C1VA83_EUMVA|nr:hypothetical protein EVAR_21880_1 [Eumeta japonica]
MCIRLAITYASPVFTHAAPNKFQVIQHKFCRVATNAHWYVQNSVFHKDLEFPYIAKFMKDTCVSSTLRNRTPMRSFAWLPPMSHLNPIILSVGHGMP